jgi:hypothetical protein
MTTTDAAVASDPSAAATAAAAAMPDAAPGAVLPCPLAAKGHPPANNPCSRQGMANATSEQAFRDGFKELQGDWSALGVDQRQARLKALADAALASSDTPPIGIHPMTSAVGDMGQLDPAAWRLDLETNNLASASLPDATVKSFADTVYHETRHAEQWYLMARLLAGNGKTAHQISRQLGLPKSVAKSAVKHPLAETDARRACASVLFDSVCGKGSTHRNRLLKQADRSYVALKAAHAAHHRSDADARATQEQKEAARQAWQRSYATYQATFKEYQALPEEADAWETAAAMMKGW